MQRAGANTGVNIRAGKYVTGSKREKNYNRCAKRVKTRVSQFMIGFSFFLWCDWKRSQHVSSDWLEYCVCFMNRQEFEADAKLKLTHNLSDFLPHRCCGHSITSPSLEVVARQGPRLSIMQISWSAHLIPSQGCWNNNLVLKTFRGQFKTKKRPVFLNNNKKKSTNISLACLFQD